MSNNNNVPHTYKTVNYDREQIKSWMISSLVYPSPSSFRSNLKYGMIPYLKESSILPMNHGNWISVLKEYLNKLTYDQVIMEYKHLDNEIMFEFHVDELYSNGTLAKRFGGDHPEAELRRMYKEYVDTNRNLIEKLTSYINSSQQGTVKYYLEQLRLLRTLNERFGNKFDVKPMRDMMDRAQLFKELSNSPNYKDYFDLSEHIAIVSDNPTEEELLALYERYPDYTSKYHHDSNVYFPSGKYNSIGGFPEGIEFIQRIDKTSIVERNKYNMSSYKNSEYTNENKQWNYDYTRYGGSQYTIISRETTYYRYDMQAASEFSNYTFEQMYALAETEWAKNPNHESSYKMLPKVKELKTKEFIIVRCDKGGNFIA